MRRTLRLREFRLLHLVMIGMLLWSACPAPTTAQVSFPLANAAPAQTPPPTQELPPPEVHPYVPPVNQDLPALAVSVATTPDLVRVGSLVTVELAIDNRAPTPATDVLVLLALPDDGRATATSVIADAVITPLPRAVADQAPPVELTNPQALPEPPPDSQRGPIDDQLTPRAPHEPSAEPALPTDGQPAPDATASPPTNLPAGSPAGQPALKPPTFVPGRDVQWTIPKLDGESRATVTLVLAVKALPTDGAILLTPWVTANHLSEPLHGTGGVLVVERDLTAMSVRVDPSSATTFQSTDGRVHLTFPAKVADQPLTVRYERMIDVAADRTARKQGVPSGGLFGRADLGAFVLTATDDSGQDRHQFTAPISMTVGYTPDQLAARGISETYLTLAWFDEQIQRWQPVPTTIDPIAHTASAAIDHFSVWTLSNGMSPSAAFVPSLQGFQADAFTGAASYHIPMAVPVGPAGSQPNLGLTYASNASDGPAGVRPNWQAGWTGKGWNLNAGGSVARVRSPVGFAWDYYTFSFGGKSYDMVRGTQLNGNPGDLYEWLWTWYSVDEGDFLKVRAVDIGNGNFTWVLWTKDGTRYDFNQLLFTTDTTNKYVYQWLLTATTDTHGNRIDYLYHVDTIQNGDFFQPTYYLSEIRWGDDGGMSTDSWGHPTSTGTARYRVAFQVASRWDGLYGSIDTNWEYPSTYFKDVVPHEAYRLDRVYVQSWRNGAGGYETIRSYALEYYPDSQSAWADIAGGQHVLTLKRVATLGSDGSQLPWTTLSYQLDFGSNWPYSNPGWNRLATLTNGQGGQISFSYAKAFGVTADATWSNYHQLTQILRQDTSGQAYSTSALTTYTYGAAAVNDRTHSVRVWYALYPPYGYGNSTSLLAHKESHEFRGHAWTQIDDYDGATLLRRTMQSFYQGDDGCTPTVNGNVIDLTTACVDRMAKREAWKGKAYQTQVYNGNLALLSQQNMVFHYELLPFYGLSNYQESTGYPRTGLWRLFTPTRVTKDWLVEGTTNTTVGKTTAFCYQPDMTQNYQQFGNQSHVLEYNQLVTIDPVTQLVNCDSPTTSVAPLRISRMYYVATEGNNYYLADRLVQRATFGTSSQLLTLTEQFYDGSTSFGGIGSRGLLTLVRSYRSMSESPMYSQDISYGYDAWGNQTTTSTYSGWGTRSSPSYSSPGNGSSARTTTIAYDSTFHALPIRQINALGHIERADYDFRMGTLTKVGGPNVADDATFAAFTCATANVQLEITCATYDAFGRMAKLVKPGDTLTTATLEAYTYDYDTPVRYLTVQNSPSNAPNDTRNEHVQFVDGLGRMVQETQEDVGWGTQMIVTDTSYDALGRVASRSQPRYATASFSYTPRSNPLFRATTMTYDSLDRALTVTAADNTQTRTSYGFDWQGLRQTTTYDAKGHAISVLTDSLGRQRGTYEYRGNGGSEGGYVVDAVTTSTYDPLDRLIQVQDTVGNTTTIAYDALGRKTSMNDPDMGPWSYAYDANGNLSSQIDATKRPTTFSYDALNRLTARSVSGPGSTYFSDGFDTKNTTTWSWSTQQTVPATVAGNNVVHSVGTGSDYNANFLRTSYSLTDGWGVRLRFKVDNVNTFAHFALESNDAAPRRFGVIAAGGTVYVQYNLDGVTWVYPVTLIPAVQTNTWYVVQLTVDAAGQFTALVFPENNPSAGSTYQAAMPAGKSWRFHHWIYSNSADIDDYEEFYGATYRYDAAIPNGKGRLYAASALMASRFVMQYDGRGRTLQARHYNWWLSTARDFFWGYDSADRVVTQTYPTGDGATYQYDAAGRPTTLVSSAVGPLVSGASYTPLDQPATRTFGNGVVQTWGYDPLSTRLSTLAVSGNALTRSYGYDPVGNLTSMSQSQPSSSLWNATFGYDHRDRLTSWTQGATNESYGYTPIGNLTTKAGVAYSYPAAGAARPHTPTLVGGSTYSYDANGNLLSGGGRSYAWTGENRPERVITSGGTETYSYDADGQRMRRGALIDFEGGLIEETAGTGAMRTNYMFNGQAVAVREPGAATVAYLHGDQLGSISLTTGAGGAVLTRQEFDPWGKIRSGGVTQTKRNFTGQYLDQTGLLYYNARYYDPNLGRFISADTIAPERSDPQTRNRYSYVLNNPLKYTDPTGHCGKSTDSAAETKACDEEIANLEPYNIHIGDLNGGLWSSNQIRDVVTAAGLMVTKLFDDKLSTFLDKIGSVTMYQSPDKTGNAWYSGSKESDAITGPGWGTAVITFYQNSFNGDFQRLVVHELGHAWDLRSWGTANHDLKIATKSGWYDGQYVLQGVTTRYARDSGTNTEDWAESVAETVFNPPSRGGTGIDSTREDVVRRHAR